jgi:SAM-dependent methyltransferase
MTERIVRHYSTYGRSAPLYDSYIPMADYETGARRLTAQIRAANPAARTLLDVGCGSGKYLEHLQHEFDCEGLDLASDFVEIARKRCPRLSIHQANMRDFDLNRKFDAISCLFLAIAYAGSVENMERAVAAMARHLNPGGVLLFEPWVYPENFWENRLTSEYVDEADRKISRMFIARREGKLSVYDIHYLVGTADGIEYFIEREELGLFTHAEYLGALTKAGLTADYDRAAGLFDAHNIGMYRGIRK